jgi:hypothetical protein
VSSSVGGHVGDLAAALVDDQLDAARRDLVLVHIAGCAPCHAEVDHQRRLKARLQALGGPGLPPALLRRLRAVGEADDPPADPQSVATVPEVPTGLPAAPVPAGVPVSSNMSLRPGILRDPHRGLRLLAGAASLVLVGVGTAYASASDGQPASPSRTPPTVFTSGRTAEPAGTAGPAESTGSSAPIREPAFGAMTATLRR